MSVITARGKLRKVIEMKEIKTTMTNTQTLHDDECGNWLKGLMTAGPALAWLLSFRSISPHMIS